MNIKTKKTSWKKQNNRAGFGDKKKSPSLKKEKAGLAARQAALDVLSDISKYETTADASFQKVFQKRSLSERDEGFVRLLVLTVLRYERILNAVIGRFLLKPLSLKQKKVQDILCLGTAQLLLLHTPPHAVLWTSVELVKADRKTAFLSGLVNAVLRKVMQETETLLKEFQGRGVNVPEWLFQSWKESYGEESATRIADSLLEEPLLYLSVKEKEKLSFWAQQLEGEVVFPESILCLKTENIFKTKGYETGSWWVQDRAASLPVLVLKEAFGGSLMGKKIADLCAAPGGKTAQLLCLGAQVDAFDISENRLKRFEENMKRLRLDGYKIKQADSSALEKNEIYDAVLLDAPCSATGTLRRHPEILNRLHPADVERLAALQKKMLLSAAGLLKKDGFVLYSTCSLQKEEGEEVVLSCPDLVHQEISSPPVNAFLTKNKDVRTFPYEEMDGFFISLLKKKN